MTPGIVAPSISRRGHVLRVTLGIASFAGCMGITVAPQAVSAAPPTSTVRVAAVGGIGLRLLDIPTPREDDPRARLYIVDHVAPGTTLHRRIEISNSTVSALHVAAYAAAANITKGEFLGAAGHSSNELSSWTSVSPMASNVSAGGSKTAIVTIAVPLDAAPAERYGVVWAEVRSAVTAGAVVEVSRVGIRLYLSVGSGAPPASSFTIASLTAKRSTDGQPTVVANVHNSGGRALDLSGTLQLSAGPGGLSAGPFAATVGVSLAIGETGSVAFGLDDRIPSGPWNAYVVLHSGLIERNASGTITFPDVGSSTGEPSVRIASRWPRFVLVGMSAFGLAAAAALGVAVKRLRSARRRVTRSTG